jgi:hypothetical protein
MRVRIHCRDCGVIFDEAADTITPSTLVRVIGEHRMTCQHDDIWVERVSNSSQSDLDRQGEA